MFELVHQEFNLAEDRKRSCTAFEWPSFNAKFSVSHNLHACYWRKVMHAPQVLLLKFCLTLYSSPICMYAGMHNICATCSHDFILAISFHMRIIWLSKKSQYLLCNQICRAQRSCADILLRGGWKVIAMESIFSSQILFLESWPRTGNNPPLFQPLSLSRL